MLRYDSGDGARAGRSVLVVEDDRATSDLLATTMADAGYEVRRAFTAHEALKAAGLRQPDLVLLDVGLPGPVDGLGVLEELRRFASPSVGVIVISGRTAEHQRLAGFAAGADDYVVKPFSPREVVERAAAILRRLGGHATTAPPPVIGGDHLQIEPAARRVMCASQEVALTRIEYGLLFDLASRPGVVRTREHLIDAAWGAELRADANTVTVHIQRLRRKLAEAGCCPKAVQTVRGLGYRFEPAIGA